MFPNAVDTDRKASIGSDLGPNFVSERARDSKLDRGEDVEGIRFRKLNLDIDRTLYPGTIPIIGSRTELVNMAENSPRRLYMKTDGQRQG